MTKSLKPKGTKNGKHRRTSKKAHSDPAGSSDHGSGGADTSTPFSPFVSLYPSTDPTTIPYAGIRTGEMIGHRLWWVVKDKGEHWLSSFAHYRLWVPGETVHGDINARIYALFISVPGGVYAYSAYDDPILLEIESARYSYKTMKTDLRFCFWDQNAIATAFVYGTIKMWGNVVEHETGYRAEYAELKSIDAIYGNGCDLKKLQKKYLP